ncbi:hypothetical protein G6M26_27280 [Agrobacterium tumefaciens]|nr:hypothetical protein [Agrobacterium tumefaciens]NTE22258.1 hypothetical protein [Agrobacterium tumefaciens]
MQVSLHSSSYVSAIRADATEEYYPGNAKRWTEAGKQRSSPPVTTPGFNHAIGGKGILEVGRQEQVADKLSRHSEALGGIDRFIFQMQNDGLIPAIAACYRTD